MSDIQMTFKRYEMKYLLDPFKYQRLRRKLEGRLVVDEYGKKTVCNIYYDTPDSRLIRTSLEKPVYKEKLRLRSYGVAQKDGTVFLELKKKYKGVVYKRRETMVLEEATRYLEAGETPGFDSQVLHEINWFLRYYKTIKPAMYISYERIAMYGVEDQELRVTFDTNILWREEKMDLREEAWGNPILEPGQYLMEIKIAGSMPIWLSDILDECEIYPSSFSKYGKAYLDKQLMEGEHAQYRDKENNLEQIGGSNCA